MTSASVKAIRLYEALGLIRAPLRQKRYRIYDAALVGRIALIRRGLMLGFRLSELREIGNTVQTDADFWQTVLHKLVVKREAVQAQISQLQALALALALALHLMETEQKLRNCMQGVPAQSEPGYAAA
ncbi:MerR family DNA-binding protein [Chitiniphilus purpureus]|uniref:MerR family DNA-binding protein n=1 Tax=Chitiniphilus purpureus TaxID=2981137 RepID=A0ABY6DMZ1_9NEIS|nr:MerR family transcriptional regulator [Chitiniphilus sp. CD1]UXY15740.1 MerR family DNA-binding protein [Chitiniphilus sp. CD1]